MKKTILLISLIFSFLLYSSNYVNAEMKKVLWVVTDSNGVEWCDFPFAKISSDDEIVVSVKKEGTYVECNNFWLFLDDEKIEEKYKIAYPSWTANLDWDEVCINKWFEISCETEKSASTISNNLDKTLDSTEKTISYDTEEDSKEIEWTWSLENEKELEATIETDVASTWTTTSTSKCMANWVEVDCNEMVDWLLNTWKNILYIAWAIIAVFTIFWLWMLIHAIANPISKKVLWIIILLIFGYIWAIIYYFVVKRKFSEVKIDADSELMI